MRPSKSRPRNKPNRNRSVGNVVNRVFDSSGPEGKVRGTPQQIIDKYNQLARDAQLSGDRVATENFQQHAEHYLRLLSGAQKEQDARRDQQERENRDRQVERDRQAERERERAERLDRQEREANDSAPDGGGGHPQPQRQGATQDLSETPQPDILDPDRDTGSTLVDTPESQPPPKRTRKPRSRKQGAQTGGDQDGAASGDTSKVAE